MKRCLLWAALFLLLSFTWPIGNTTGLCDRNSKNGNETNQTIHYDTPKMMNYRFPAYVVVFWGDQKRFFHQRHNNRRQSVHLFRPPAAMKVIREEPVLAIQYLRYKSYLDKLEHLNEWIVRLLSQYDIVLVWKLDRFSRNRYDSARYKAVLKKKGVRVVSVTEVISEGAEGILFAILQYRS